MNKKISVYPNVENKNEYFVSDAQTIVRSKMEKK